MRCLVVGYGSIGARHARLLCSLGHEVAVISRREEVEFPLLSRDEAVREAWDIVVIATPTGNHAEDYAFVAASLQIKRILLEKPVFSAMSQLPEGIPPSIQELTYIGYNLRFHPVVRAATIALKGCAIYSACFYAGQYLPDWRPGTDYRNCYSANKHRGGGVLRDLSHELDLACFFTGSWQKISAIGSKVSQLEISADDIFSLLSAHEHCAHVVVHLNYLDRMKRRYFVINCDKGTVCGDLSVNTLSVNGETEYFDCTADTTYKHQLHALLQGTPESACTFAEGLDVTRMIDAAESAALEERWIVK